MSATAGKLLLFWAGTEKNLEDNLVFDKAIAILSLTQKLADILFD